MAMNEKTKQRHHVVIIGSGFGGLFATKALKDGRIQAVVATMGLSGSNSRRCMAFAGVIPPSVLRGLALSSVATSSSRAGEWTDRSVPLGKYWRSNPFVFSLGPRCHGE
jgi:hypothetical protein